MSFQFLDKGTYLLIEHPVTRRRVFAKPSRTHTLFLDQAVAMREARDVAMLEEKLDRPLHAAERARIGVSRLRLFLEQLLQRR